VLFGLLPALRVADVNANAAIREGPRAGSGPGKQRVWSILVAVEVALALVLLVGSGLMLRSFAAVLGVDVGFEPRGVLTVVTDLPEHAYPNVAMAVAFQDRALDAVRRIPGVTAAGVTNVLPLDGENPSGGIQVAGRPLLPIGHPITGFAVYRIVSPGYFDAMGMKILKGRGIAESDVAGGAPVVVVNEALAKDGWPGEDPIGKQMRIGGMDGPEFEPFATVVGIVKNVAGSGVTAPVRPAYYYSISQLPYRTRWMTMVVKTSLPPTGLVPQIRAALRSIDPDVPAEFETLESRFASSIADRRFTMTVLATFAIAALLLAGVGIYGVVSYAVAQRTREIGIRLALGAQPGDVVLMVQGRALLMVGAGIVAGAIGALALTRVMRSLLFEISPTDPLTFGAVALVLLAAGWLASWLPARRGTRIDPLLAIRSE
jgi:predicted permease